MRNAERKNYGDWSKKQKGAPVVSGYTLPSSSGLKKKFRWLWLATPLVVWGQLPQAVAPNNLAIASPISLNVQIAQIKSSSSSSDYSDAVKRKKDLDDCRSQEVKSLPGSHQFASDFIETVATDPDVKGRNRKAVWVLTADLSTEVSPDKRAMYISKSTDGGGNWTQVARIDSKYFDAEIGEGLRNGLSVSPGGTEFVITTQLGAFQVLPRSNASAPLVKSIVGPRVPPLQQRPRVSIPKQEGDPVRAGVVEIAPDGKHMIVGYGYFDLAPQLLSFHKNREGSWIKDGPLPNLPTDMDILSLRLDNSKKPRPGALYLGTGDQAFLFNFHTKTWTRIDGVGPDSAIHGMTLVGGLHLAACWGIYNPLSAVAVKRVTDARFLLHRAKDETGPNLRAYSIDVDPLKPNREIVTSLTGVYTSGDSGQTWKRLNDLPEGEFRTAHFNTDGTVIVSGITGTFLTNPFSPACTLHLRTRSN